MARPVAIMMVVLVALFSVALAETNQPSGGDGDAARSKVPTRANGGDGAGEDGEDGEATAVVGATMDMVDIPTIEDIGGDSDKSRRGRILSLVSDTKEWRTVAWLAGYIDQSFLFI
eukprot:CAMPEP_0184677612 /NCGR_PEP_ID=MMETSP0312-20130426/190_1 /TAXON_ID=31354 /ORGANISM="Compsopogon coeruleus, Strain SAG 36.94" /LENGTH=115 /DNA_ID=CAMNT_0027125573 /DNA_START=88 /DNA_END=436 /DNA_ORIENTATION=+